MARETQAVFIREMRTAVEARGLTLRDDPSYSNTGTLTVTDPARPLGTPIAIVGYSFNDGYATFACAAIFDEATRPRRPWHHADYADGSLDTVLDLITRYLDATRETPASSTPFTPDGCAEAGRRALASWPHSSVSEDAEDKADNLADLLADLMHYAREEEIDFDAAVLRGAGHYEAELAEAGIVVFGGSLLDGGAL